MKLTIISIIVSVLLIGGVFFMGKNKNSDTEKNVPVNNVTIVDGTQIIEIKAKGGYFPQKSFAKAGLPTVIKFNTAGTFDCSSYVRIPSVDVNQVLSQSGTTEINIGVNATSTMQGFCGMGMYPFEIEFQ